MRTRVFSLLGVLFVIASIMMMTRQLIRVQAVTGCPNTYTVDSDVFTTTGPCSSPPASLPVPQRLDPFPSCPPTPADARVGVIIVASTPAFSAPLDPTLAAKLLTAGTSQSAISGITLIQGSKWLVLGLDQTKQFYAILISCKLVWIPARAIGPSPDGTLANAPLPTTIIDSGIAEIDPNYIFGKS